MGAAGNIFFLGVVALTTTLLLTPVVRGAAMRWGRVSRAHPDRWHERPTPNVGGVAIFAGFALAVAVGVVLDSGNLSSLDLSERAVVPLTHRDGLLLAATLIFLLGLVDDFVPLMPGTKLVGELAAAAVLLMSHPGWSGRNQAGGPGFWRQCGGCRGPEKIWRRTRRATRGVSGDHGLARHLHPPNLARGGATGKAYDRRRPPSSASNPRRRTDSALQSGGALR